MLRHSAIAGGKRIVHIQDDTGALAFEVSGTVDVEPGTVVDIAGFPGTFFGTPLVTSSLIEKRQPGVLPASRADAGGRGDGGEERRRVREGARHVRGDTARAGLSDADESTAAAPPSSLYVYDWPVARRVAANCARAAPSTSPASAPSSTTRWARRRR